LFFKSHPDFLVIDPNLKSIAINVKHDWDFSDNCLIQGNNIHTKHVGKDILAGIKTFLVSGNLLIPNFFLSFTKKPPIE